MFETFGLADHLVRTLSGGYRPRAVCLVGPDTLFAAAESAYLAVDRRGRLLAARLPGRPVAVSGDYLVVRTDTGDPPLTSRLPDAEVTHRTERGCPPRASESSRRKPEGSRG